MINPFEIFEARLNNIESLLLDLKHGQKKDIDSSQSINQPLTIQEAAAFLRLAVPTVYALVGKSAIPFSKKGQRLYFSKPELSAWIASGRKSTTAEIAEAAVNSIGGKRGRV